jgi:quinol monooxygenase YgiN
MVNLGLLVRLDAKPGRDDDVEEFLRSAQALVRLEPATTAWFAVRFGRSEYGIFDVFPDEVSREAHLAGAVATALREKADALFTQPPRIEKVRILADKLPATVPTEPDTKALLLTFKAKSGHEQDVEQFLRDAQSFVQQEPKTTAWFAIHLENGEYGTFDVFPDNGGRLSHLTGHIPRELVKHSLSWLGSVPDMDMLNVLAENFAVPPV